MVFPVWSLSTALLTKVSVEAICGPLALLMSVANRDAHPPPPGPAGYASLLLTMYQLHARGLQQMQSPARLCPGFLPYDEPWFFLSRKCIYLSALSEKLPTFQIFPLLHLFWVVAITPPSLV